MFARAKPYIDVNVMKKVVKGSSQDINYYFNKNYLFFNSGRSAIKWILKNINNGKRAKVGIQAFTCDVMKQAILESENEIIYIDTDMKYYTSLMKNLSGFEYIDILVLTHLFGVPNPDYEKIKKWACQNNIIIIDDLSQTIGAKVNGKKIEEMSDYYIYSFSYDKPVSANSGGMLKIPEKYYLKLKKEYDKLEVETKKKTLFDLKQLCFYDKMLDKNVYKCDFRTNNFIEKIIINLYGLNASKFQIKLAYSILSTTINFIIGKCENKLLKVFKNQNIEIKAMNELKIRYLAAIWEENIHYNERYKQIAKKAEKYLSINDIAFNSVHDNISIECKPGLRFAITSKDSKRIIDILNKRGIEASNSNWRRLISPTSEYEKYAESYEITKKIINLPIWDWEIWEHGK